METELVDNFFEFEKMVEKQKQMIKREKEIRREEYHKKMQSMHNKCVPAKVRLLSLLDVAREHELKKSTLINDEYTIERNIAIIKVYKSLVTNVRYTLNNLKKQNIPEENVFNMSSEAINYFSSYFPWTDSHIYKNLERESNNNFKNLPKKIEINNEKIKSIKKNQMNVLTKLYKKKPFHFYRDCFTAYLANSKSIF
jgi:hypothetical protein